MLVRCAVWSSIVGRDATEFDTPNCSVKYSTFGTVEMLISHNVDVIFGPWCSKGMSFKPTAIDIVIVL